MMDAQSNLISLTAGLARDIYYQIVHTLRGLLPPVTSAPEDEIRRDRATIAHVACLLPANAEEANLAAQYVAAGAQALHCQRIANQYRADAPFQLKCYAQSASMMRQARSWRALLSRVQAERIKREADTAARDAAAETEHRAIGLMADALAHTAPASAPPEPASEPTPATSPQPTPIAEAEDYALHHRKRAALIRRLGRLPRKLNVGPLPRELVHAIVTGTTPILRALDEKPRRALAFAS
jgi:hypothetical protein